MYIPFLTILVFFPLVGALLLLLLPRLNVRTLYTLAGVWALLELIGAAFLVDLGDYATAGYNAIEPLNWVPSLGLNYRLGLDNISAWLVILTAFLTLVTIVGAGFIAPITDRPNVFLAWVFGLEMGIIGVFLSTNLLLFYVFWEVMIIPAYFLIGQWGGPNRVRAAVRFVLYTFAGSLLMLVSILALVFLTTPAGGVPSLDFESVRKAIVGLPAGTQDWLFLGFAAGFIVKVPLIPFQSWLPDAYSESPAPVTVMLAGAMSKTGAYGFLRFGVFLFPNAAHDFAPWLAGLALVNIIYGALAALAQTDLRRLLAYSSLSHMGFIILGIFAMNSQGVSGAVLQMVNHGIVTPALFLALAAMARRVPSQNLNEIGGLQKVMPRLAALFLVLGLASLGLPGLNQFAGEFLILGGSFLVSPIYAVVAVVGLVLAAWYMMRFFQAVWHGPEKHSTAVQSIKVMDMQLPEFALFVPLVLLIVLLGVAPIIVTGPLSNTVTAWLAPVIIR